MKYFIDLHIHVKAKALSLHALPTTCTFIWNQVKGYMDIYPKFVFVSCGSNCIIRIEGQMDAKQIYLRFWDWLEEKKSSYADFGQIELVDMFCHEECMTFLYTLMSNNSDSLYTV